MAHPDLDALLNALLPFARQTLENYGEFYPFGAKMTSEGQIVECGASSEKVRPPSQEVIDILRKAFRDEASAGKIRAAGICMDTRIVPPSQIEKTDAICVCLEHHSGEAVKVFMPYRIQPPNQIKYGDVFATPGCFQIFTKYPSAN